MEEEDRCWFLGVDWGSAEHFVRLADGSGRELGRRKFAHTGEGLAHLAEWVLGLSGAEPRQVHIAIEVPHGPVVESLMERGFRVFALNPKQTDRFRDRFSPAGAKDDSRDSEVLSDALRTDAKAFRELARDPALLVELREWSRLHDEVSSEHTRLSNQLRDQLWRYYPQALQLAGSDVGSDWFLELWALAPTPQAARSLRKAAAARILARHRIRRIDAAGVIEILQAPAVQVAPGTAEAARAHIGLLAKRLTLVNQQSRDIDKQLDRLTQALSLAQEQEPAPGQPLGQRDVAILRSLPGIGRVVHAALLAEAFEPLQRRDYHAVRCLCGAAPVTKRSGKTTIVMRRRAANPRLVNALYHWARTAVQHDPISREKYAALRARGRTHARALRTVGDRLIGVACAMLQAQTDFDPSYSRGTNRAA